MMGIESGLRSAGNFVGITETAYLVIDDAGQTTKPSVVFGKYVVNTLAKKALGDNMMKNLNNGSGGKNFKVQFNPKELLINTSREVISNSDKIDANGSRALKTATSYPDVFLDVTLIFDKVNNPDCFSSSQVSAKTAGLLVTKALGKHLTVQTEVEGLIAALKSEYTRRIKFQWADFSFSGSIVNVNSKYVMFSTAGRPVRATVNIRLKQKINKENISDWRKDFDKAFSGESSSLVSGEQRVQNLLNLKQFL